MCSFPLWKEFVETLYKRKYNLLKKYCVKALRVSIKHFETSENINFLKIWWTKKTKSVIVNFQWKRIEKLFQNRSPALFGITPFQQENHRPNPTESETRENTILSTHNLNGFTIGSNDDASLSKKPCHQFPDDVLRQLVA